MQRIASDRLQGIISVQVVISMTWVEPKRILCVFHAFSIFITSAYSKLGGILRSANREKTAVLVVIGTVLILSAASFLIEPEIVNLVRFALGGGLCWFLYKGKNWARWTFSVLVGFAAAFVLYAVVAIPMFPIGYVMLVGLMLVYVAAVAALFSPKLAGPYFVKDAT